MIAAVRLLTPLAWRNLWRNGRRTGITLVVVAVGMSSVLMFDVAIRAVAESSKQESLRLLTGAGQIHAAGYLDDPTIDHAFAAPRDPLASALKRAPVTAWAPRLRVPAVIQSEYRTRAVTLLGVEPKREPAVSDLPHQILGGRYLSSSDDPGLVIGADLALKLKTGLGRRVVVMTQTADGGLAETGATIVGLFGNIRPAQDEFVFTGLTRAQSLIGARGRLSEISFDVEARSDPARAVAALRAAAPDLDVRGWMALSPLAYALETLSGAYVAIWLGVMFVLMAIGVVNTQLMAVHERRREFGLLQALGLSPSMIVLLVVIETGLLMALGVGVGLSVSLAVTAATGGSFDLTRYDAALERFGFSGVLHPSLPLDHALPPALAIWVLGLGAALWPALTAAATRPAEAMRP